jgi:hypothetical protein
MTNEKAEGAFPTTAFSKMDFTKEEFARWVDETGETKVSDEQWEKVAELLDKEVASYVDDVIYEAVVMFRSGDFNE